MGKSTCIEFVIRFVIPSLKGRYDKCQSGGELGQFFVNGLVERLQQALRYPNYRRIMQNGPESGTEKVVSIRVKKRT